MTTLIIDTTDNEKTAIKLQAPRKMDEITQNGLPKSQIALVLIEKILKINNLAPLDIDEIKVNTGPGSFTGTRVGVAIANALGFALDRPVNNSKSKTVSPRYK